MPNLPSGIHKLFIWEWAALAGTCRDNFNIILSVHCDSDNSHTSNNAHNLYKAINHPCTWFLLNFSEINRQQHGDTRLSYTAQILDHFGCQIRSRSLCAHNHTQYRQGQISQLYWRICQHHSIYSIHNFTFTAAIIYFKYCICMVYLLILHCFVLVPPWGWWFIPKACRRVHIYGWIVSL